MGGASLVSTVKVTFKGITNKRMVLINVVVSIFTLQDHYSSPSPFQWTGNTGEPLSAYEVNICSGE